MTMASLVLSRPMVTQSLQWFIVLNVLYIIQNLSTGTGGYCTSEVQRDIARGGRATCRCKQTLGALHRATLQGLEGKMLRNGSGPNARPNKKMLGTTCTNAPSMHPPPPPQGIPSPQENVLGTTCTSMTMQSQQNDPMRCCVCSSPVMTDTVGTLGTGSFWMHYTYKMNE